MEAAGNGILRHGVSAAAPPIEFPNDERVVVLDLLETGEQGSALHRAPDRPSSLKMVFLLQGRELQGRGLVVSRRGPSRISCPPFCTPHLQHVKAFVYGFPEMMQRLPFVEP
jgi:hypothetical protein